MVKKEAVHYGLSTLKKKEKKSPEMAFYQKAEISKINDQIDD